MSFVSDHNFNDAADPILLLSDPRRYEGDIQETFISGGFPNLKVAFKDDK